MEVKIPTLEEFIKKESDEELGTQLWYEAKLWELAVDSPLQKDPVFAEQWKLEGVMKGFIIADKCQPKKIQLRIVD